MFISLVFSFFKTNAIHKTEHAAWDLNGSCENQLVKVSLGTDACPFVQGVEEDHVVTLLGMSVALVQCCRTAMFLMVPRCPRVWSVRLQGTVSCPSPEEPSGVFTDRSGARLAGKISELPDLSSRGKSLERTATSSAVQQTWVQASIPPHTWLPSLQERRQ